MSRGHWGVKGEKLIPCLPSALWTPYCFICTYGAKVWGGVKRYRVLKSRRCRVVNFIKYVVKFTPSWFHTMVYIKETKKRMEDWTNFKFEWDVLKQPLVSSRLHCLLSRISRRIQSLHVHLIHLRCKGVVVWRNIKQVIMWNGLLCINCI